MRIRTALAAAAVVLGLGVAAATPASAHHFGPHFGGFHHGFHHWGPHWGGGFGVIDVGGYDDCIRWRPSYDDYGNYIGRRPANVCD